MSLRLIVYARCAPHTPAKKGVLRESSQTFHIDPRGFGGRAKKSVYWAKPNRL
jgi:hypothetical protein